MNKSVCQADPLPKALREGPDHLAADIPKSTKLEHFIHAGSKCISAKALQLAAKSQVFTYPHIPVEGDRLRKIANSTASLEGVPVYVEAIYGGRSAAGGQKSG